MFSTGRTFFFKHVILQFTVQFRDTKLRGLLAIDIIDSSEGRESELST